MQHETQVPQLDDTQLMMLIREYSNDSHDQSVIGIVKQMNSSHVGQFDRRYATFLATMYR